MKKENLVISAVIIGLLFLSSSIAGGLYAIDDYLNKQDCLSTCEIQRSIIKNEYICCENIKSNKVLKEERAKRRGTILDRTPVIIDVGSKNNE